MPCSGSQGRLVAYLLGQKVRYVAFSYASQAGYPAEIFESHTDPRLFARTIVLATRYAIEFNKLLEGLRQSHASVYDDGRLATINLVQTVQP